MFQESNDISGNWQKPFTLVENLQSSVKSLTTTNSVVRRNRNLLNRLELRLNSFIGSLIQLLTVFDLLQKSLHDNAY